MPELEAHRQEMERKAMSCLFSEDPGRFERFSIELGDLLFDYSKNRACDRTLGLLLRLAKESGLEGAIQQMFEGAKINRTENRAVLHTALRSRSDAPLWVDGVDVRSEIREVLAQMKAFSRAVISGAWRGHTGKPIETIINIGIGGSDLGPSMVTEALRPYRNHLALHYVSNVDGSQMFEALRQSDPETTLVLIASKTFGTQETMANAHTARQWLLASGASEKDIALHFVAISTNREKVTAFGIPERNMFRFWDWVGGRYSLWSAIGLSICLALGYEKFEELLNGAEAMDDHFRTADWSANVPVIMALLGIWYIQFFDARTHAILPYDQYFHRLPAFLQQADMESNGKSVTRDGQKVAYATGPVIWGETGTNGQHAFFQLLHQGTQLVPCDFIASARPQRDMDGHHELLLSNFFAQTEALMKGKSPEEVEAALLAEGHSPEEAKALLPHQTFTGNRPSNTFFLKQMTPYNLGMLLAAYEHKIFVQGVVWNIFSFDQWGVELGKELADKILPELKGTVAVGDHDSSTVGLLQRYRAWKK